MSQCRHETHCQHRTGVDQYASERNAFSATIGCVEIGHELPMLPDVCRPEPECGNDGSRRKIESSDEIELGIDVDKEEFSMIELVFAVLLIFYIAPFSVAAARDHHATMPILIANLTLGWTVVGWWLVLFWAYYSPAQTHESRARNRQRYVEMVSESKPAMPRILHGLTKN
jgi:hypothetical protein